MNEKKSNFGNILEMGDFMCIAMSTWLDFGFYFGEGKETIQYYSTKNIIWLFENYNKALVDTEHWNHKKAISESFSIKWLRKSFLVNTSPYRILKLPNPIELFKDQESLDEYNKAVEILKQLRIIKPD